MAHTRIHEGGVFKVAMKGGNSWTRIKWRKSFMRSKQLSPKTVGEKSLLIGKGARAIEAHSGP